MELKTNLFIVGAPKASTTSLYYYLKTHPEVYFPNLKETNYFSHQEIIEQKLYYKAKITKSERGYLNLYSQHESQKILGDASVSYLYYPNIPNKIFRYNPEAKIIIILRDPIQRAFSHYLMDYRLGHVREKFINIFHQETKFPLQYQQYFLISKYYNQVKRYLEIFNDNVKILYFKDLQKDSKTFMKEVCRFLEIKTYDSMSYDKKHNPFVVPKNLFWNHIYSNSFYRIIVKVLFPNSVRKLFKRRILLESKKPILDSAVRNELIVFFKSDILNLEKLIKKDLSAWYAE